MSAAHRPVATTTMVLTWGFGASGGFLLLGVLPSASRRFLPPVLLT